MHPRPNYMPNEMMQGNHDSQNSSEYVNENVYYPPVGANYHQYQPPYMQNDPIHENQHYEFPYGHEGPFYYPNPHMASFYNEGYGPYNSPQQHGSYDNQYMEGQRSPYSQFNPNFRPQMQYPHSDIGQTVYYHDGNMRNFPPNIQHMYPQGQVFQSPNESQQPKPFIQQPNIPQQQLQNAIAEKSIEVLPIPPTVIKEILDSSYAYADSNNYDEIKSFISQALKNPVDEKVLEVSLPSTDVSKSGLCIATHSQNESKDVTDDASDFTTSAFEEMKTLRQEVLNMGISPVDPLDFEVFKRIQPHECNLEVPKSVEALDNQSMPFSLNDLVHDNGIISIGFPDITISKPENVKNFTSSNAPHRKATDIDYPVPSEYLIYKSIKDKMAKFDCKLFGDDLLLYIYYSSYDNKMKMSAISHLYSRNWRFHLTGKRWYRLPPSYNPGDFYTYFDPNKWETVKTDKSINLNEFETESYQQYYDFQTNVVLTQMDLLNGNEHLISDFVENVLQINPP